MSKVELRYNTGNKSDLNCMEIQALRHTSEMSRKTPYKQQELEMITQELLHELFTYDKEIGKLIYKKHTNNRIKVGDIVGFISTCGYRRCTIHGKSYKHSRLVWLYNYGYLPKFIDHIDGNKDNDKLDNLREVTVTENRRNSCKPSHNTSGSNGVNFHKSRNKWRAFIGINGKHIHLGYFDNKEDAIVCREKAQKEYGFTERHGKDLS